MKKSIDLKYLDYFYFEPRQDLSEKIEKVVEEHHEVLEAFHYFNKGSKTASELADELLDSILSSINALKKLSKDELVDLETVVNKHRIKIECYAREKYEI